MNEEKYSLKFIIIGDPSVGKTNIMYRYSKGEFKGQYSVTICVEYLTKNIVIDNTSFRLELWDTAGSERYLSITRGYYNNSACAIIVYDITNIKSFEHVSKWVEECQQTNGKNIYMILVGNKDDLKDNRKITEEQGKDLASKYDLKFFETSALTGHNIEEVFNLLEDMRREFLFV